MEGRPLRRRPWRLIALVIILAAAIYVFWPNPHSWESLGPHLGRIRWVDTRTDALVEHPLAPGWIRGLHSKGIPWPTDLPLSPLGASFGGSGSTSTSAWYLIQSSKPSQELWHLDKDSAHLIDKSGVESKWTGATGSVLVDTDRRLQFLYLGVAPESSRTGAHLRFRLSRFGNSAADAVHTHEVTVPF